MNPILNDPLVVRYFWRCNADHDHSEHGCRESMALRVLDAMCAPLKINEKYLYIGSIESRGALVEILMGSDVSDLHPRRLRLPDSFQEPDYEKELAARLSRVSEVVIVGDLIDLARKAERQKMEREAKR